VASAAIQVGDVKDDVIFELGKPTGQLGVGDTLVLNYPDQIIKLKANRVVSIKQVAVSASAPRVTAPSAKATAGVPSNAKPAAEPPGDPLVWTTNYKAALDLATTTNRQTFLFFTGSNWCSWCKRFEAEILETPAFRAYASKKLVMVKLDFPRGVEQPEDVVAQNRSLSKRFRIDGYPTVVVLGVNGKPLANLGYQPGGPAPFITALSELEQATAQ